MKPKITLVAILLISTTMLQAVPPLLSDHFDKEENPTRKASRGEWKIADGMMTCDFDEELYKKFKNHGPIVFYELKHKDVVVTYSFKATNSKFVTFTTNGNDGHVFRYILTPDGYNVRTFQQADEEHTSKAAGRGDDVSIKSGEWIRASFASKGDEVIVKIGDDFEKTFKDTSFDRGKKNISVSFGEGTFAIKDFEVTNN